MPLKEPTPSSLTPSRRT
ncbi:hypothetical protein E2C01_099415 [Portunus trituberculatus]|uniref:Uncharacterized protein n=1 Tax=Portunus trituberculatus TaxID=210409 RepID=A0A5B7K0A6_PORTR|nr:hypothetical protein [Portunus trituberculatus]